LTHQLSKRRAFVYCLTPNFCLKQGFKEPAKRRILDERSSPRAAA